MLSGHCRPVGHFLSQRLNTRFLVVGHRDHLRLANLAAQQSFIENLYFLVNMQYRRHLGRELRVPSLHIVTNLMRSKFSLHQDLMQLGALLIENLQGFLLELGKGFALVAHQQRISTDSKDFSVDLIFYNYLLKCFVLFDLKTEELSHQYIGYGKPDVMKSAA